MRGVDIGESRDPWAYGGLADIFRASLNGGEVAVKRLRVNERGTVRAEIHKVCLLPFHVGTFVEQESCSVPLQRGAGMASAPAPERAHVAWNRRNHVCANRRAVHGVTVDASRNHHGVYRDERL